MIDESYSVRQAEVLISMRMVDLILKKRRGGELSRDELEWMIGGYVRGEIPDYQFSAFLMAVCFVGCTARETADLTMIMATSGGTLDLSPIPGIKVDKHSTGGVADTTTLIVAPMVAALGLPVVKMSGRGLGHSGGTLDKLESIPGVDTAVSTEEFLDLASENGIAVVGQSADLVPADKLIYALRDVTGTVDSIPLIASSVMSKKIAAGCDAIVLDVKYGSGAFMQNEEDASELAEAMVQIGSNVGRETVAVITDMNQPLGRAIGNALEVEEAVDALSGRVPYDDPLMSVCFTLAKKMIQLGMPGTKDEEAESMLLEVLANGSAKGKLKTLVDSLGGNGEGVIKCTELPRARERVPIYAKSQGYIASMDCEALGRAALLLGAGRATKADVIDPAVGIMMCSRVGDMVYEGDVLAELHVNDGTNAETAKELVREAIIIGGEYPKMSPLIFGVVDINSIALREATDNEEAPEAAEIGESPQYAEADALARELGLMDA